jgi:hypothetical protein
MQQEREKNDEEANAQLEIKAQEERKLFEAE